MPRQRECSPASLVPDQPLERARSRHSRQCMGSLIGWTSTNGLLLESPVRHGMHTRRRSGSGAAVTCSPHSAHTPWSPRSRARVPGDGQRDDRSRARVEPEGRRALADAARTAVPPVDPPPSDSSSPECGEVSPAPISPRVASPGPLCRSCARAARPPCPTPCAGPRGTGGRRCSR